ncbi:DPP IV N-terminal domain-containing protein [Paraflavitalea speifideaquila]|uniref:DPP IV N-terminal domain-containing protein n=1 Tax=Paraflavitalea speifideaquila TaxID=3076558 RepID=UPI0028EA165A|nr:hypothetical protein [Paraflavitalea speifideiaquila]
MDDASVRYNTKRTQYLFVRQGDIYLGDVKTGQQKPLTQTTEFENNPFFAFNDNKVVYTRGLNVYAWDIIAGTTIQLTNFQSGAVATPAPIMAGPQRGGGGQGQGGEAASAVTVQPPLATSRKNGCRKKPWKIPSYCKAAKKKRDLADSMRKAQPKEKHSVPSV